MGQLPVALSSPLSKVTGILDINTGHSCGRATDSEMAPGSSLDQNKTKALGGREDYSDLLGPTKAQPLDTNLALGGSPGL